MPLDNAHHYRIRWRSTSHRQRRVQVYLAALILAAALLGYWGLLRACHRMGTSEAVPETPAQSAFA